MRRLSTHDADFAVQLDALLDLQLREEPAVAATVAGIIDDVRARGDEALIELTERLDGWQCGQPSELEIPASALAAAYEGLAVATRDAIEVAHARILSYHQRQLPEDLLYEDEFGNRLGQRWTPVDRAGVYVPGGKAAYPSSVLMTVTVARAAGVPEVVLVVPTPAGERNQSVLAAAHVAGASRVFAIGGAQAIAALAYGTATVPRVDTIAGPGNAYVAAAKRQVFGQVGIDSIAGPSEVLVIADASAPPEWIALDLFSQAEHDEAAQALLLSADAGLLDAVEAAMQRLLPEQPRRDIIQASLEARGALVLVRDLAEAVEVANRIAAEHLELMVEDPHALVGSIRHAGAIFLGHRTAEVLGDYVAGPSHVLPTYGTARYASPLSVYDFKKRSSVIDLTARGAAELAATAQHLAEVEGLAAHAAAAAARRSNR